MGKFTLTGILITVAVFLLLFGLLLTQIKVYNPLTEQETSIFVQILEWIIP